MRRIAFLFFAGALFCAADSLRAEVTTTGDVDPGGAATQPDPWAEGGDLSVGDTGVGKLHIESGGAVTNFKGFIGRSSGSTGEVTVTGADSQWTNSSDLYIGGRAEGVGGTAAVAVLDGGSLDVDGVTKVYSGSTLTLGTGTFTSGGIVMEGGTIAASAAAGEVGGLFWPMWANSPAMAISVCSCISVRRARWPAPVAA